MALRQQWVLTRSISQGFAVGIYYHTCDDKKKSAHYSEIQESRIRVNYFFLFTCAHEFTGFCERKCSRRSFIQKQICSFVFDYAFFFLLGAYLANNAWNCFWFDIPHTGSSLTENTPVWIAGKRRLHIFSPSQKHVINNIQTYFFFLFFFFSSSQVRIMTEWYLSVILLRVENPPNCSLNLLPSISSSGNNSVYTHSQPGQVTAPHSHHPNLTAMIHRGPPLRLRSGISSPLDG